MLLNVQYENDYKKFSDTESVVKIQHYAVVWMLNKNIYDLRLRSKVVQVLSFLVDEKQRQDMIERL